MGPWSEQHAEVRTDAGGWISGPQEPATEDQMRAMKLADMRRDYPGASIFKIAGGWGAIAGAHEWAATGNTLDELADKLEAYFG
jgi:hypothetical protein